MPSSPSHECPRHFRAYSLLPPLAPLVPLVADRLLHLSRSQTLRTCPPSALRSISTRQSSRSGGSCVLTRDSRLKTLVMTAYAAFRLAERQQVSQCADQVGRKRHRGQDGRASRQGGQGQGQGQLWRYARYRTGALTLYHCRLVPEY